MAGRNYLSHFATLLLLFFSSLITFAGPSRTTYQAKIVKPNGYPLEATNVAFSFTILDPAGSCALYSETYSSVNMSSTGGLISFSLGSGIKTFPASGTTFEQVFSNITPNMACDTGGGPPAVYTPMANDARKVVMQFNDGAGWQTLPAMNINAVPYAMYANDAQKFNGLEVSDFAQMSMLPSCGVSDALTYNGAAFSCVAAGGGGGSVTSGSVITALGYTPADGASLTTVTSNLSQVSSTVFSVSSTVSSLTSSVSSLQSSVAASFAAITSSQWVTSGASLVYNSGYVGIGTASASALLDVGDYGTPVFKSTVLIANDVSGISGVEMKNKNLATNAEFRFAVFDTATNYLAFTQPSVSNTGTIFGLPRSQTSMILTNSNSGTVSRDLAIGTYKQNNLVFGTNSYERLRITASGTVGIGTSAPVTALDVAGGVRISFESATCATSYAGTLRYNAGLVEYCNGTTWSAFGVAGAGITNLNGSASGSQTFVIGTSGTAFNIATLNGQHSFNIPFAASGGVTAGLLSHADYITFSNKASSVSVTNVSNQLTTVSNTVTSLQNSTASSFTNLSSAVSAIVSSQWTTSASHIYYTAGNVGIGTSTPSGRVDIETSIDNQSIYNLDSSLNQSISASGSFVTVGLHSWVRPMVSGGVTNTGTAYSAALRGVRNTESVNDNGILTSLFGAHIAVGHSNVGPSSPTTTSITGLHIDPMFGVGTISSFYGVRVGSPSLSGASVTARYGFAQDDTLAKNYFLGQTGIGTANPSALLHLGANTATVAALKLTSGTLLSTPASGAIEYDGSQYYLTDGVGVRRAIATVSGAGNFSGVSNLSSTGNITLTPSGSVIVSSTTASTNSTTGALVVQGGLGVAGNINASGTITTSSNIQGASITSTLGIITPIIYGSTNISGVLQLESTTNPTKGSVLIAQQGGMVGIGTNTPLAKLSVDGDGMSPNTPVPGTVATFDRESGDVSIGMFTSSVNKANIYFGVTGAASRGALSYQFNATGNNDQMRFDTNGQTRLTIVGSGTVGIGTGTAVPNAMLQVQNNVLDQNILTLKGAASQSGHWLNMTDSSNVTRGYISPNGGMPTLRLGVTNAIALTAEYGGINEIPAGASLNTSGNLGIFNANGTVGAKVMTGYFNGSTFYSATEISNVASGFGNLLLMRSGGNVGIGTSTPSAKLDVNDGAGRKVAFAPAGVSGDFANLPLIHLENSNNVADDWFFVNAADKFHLTTEAASGTEKLTVTSSGNVGIGTSAPTQSLEVVGSGLSVNRTGTFGSVASFTKSYTATNNEDPYISIYHQPSSGGATERFGYIQAGQYLGGMLLQAQNGGSGYSSLLLNRLGGNVGIGLVSPTAKLDVAGSNSITSETTTYATMVIKDTEAQLDIISPSLGAWGSAINLIETSSTTKLIENSWSIYRGASELADSTLHFKYGTNKTVGNNPTLFSMTTDGRFGIGTTAAGARLQVATPSSGTINNRITTGNSNTDLINVTGLSTGDIYLDHLVGARFYANTPTAVSRVTTLKIDGAPSVSGTNLTVDNLLALYVQNGNSSFGGNVGFGTTSPSAKVNISGLGAANATALRIDSQDTYYRDIFMSEFNTTTYGGILRYHSGSDLFQMITLEAGVEKYGVAVARATGFVGIGMNSAASYQLDVNGDIRITGTPYRAGGDIAWTVPSDQRLKDVVRGYNRGLNEILNIDTIIYRYKKGNVKDIDPTKEFSGVLAQQVQKQIPEAVSVDKDGFLSLNTTPIFWAMINAIKEVYQQVVEVMKNDQAQDRMIAAVKAENEAIKAENNKIKQENTTIKAYLCEKDPQASICK